MIYGAHESVAGGLHLAFERAAKDGCKAVQIFTKNSNMWREPALTDEQIAAFRAAKGRFGGPVMAHVSYLVNLATGDPDLLSKSVGALVAEVERSSALGVDFVVLHPGAHLGAGEDAGLDRAAEALDAVLERTDGKSARILLENTAGQGTCVGHRFEHLGAILSKTSANARARLGVCFDTQHAYAAGYDMTTREGYERTWDEFDRLVGLASLAGFHLNDSKKALGSRVDRHEHIGEGNLGLPLFWRLLNDPRFRDTPAVLETEPEEGELRYAREIRLLGTLVGAGEPAPNSPFALALSPSQAPKPSGRSGKKTR
jgi:deoxyribonuclease IV